MKTIQALAPVFTGKRSYAPGEHITVHDAKADQLVALGLATEKLTQPEPPPVPTPVEKPKPVKKVEKKTDE